MRTVLVRFVGSFRVSTFTANVVGTFVAEPTCFPAVVSASSPLAPGTFVVPRTATTPCTQAVRGVIAQRRGSALKTAVTSRSASRVVEQAPLPRHAPAQPRKTKPVAGVAVRLTAEPLRNVDAHAGPQSMPG